MDHLPYPPNAHWPPITIPCFLDAATSRYDGHGFINFSSRTGWQTERSQWFHCESHQAAARAQSWLWLGLIQEVFGASVQESLFVTRDQRGVAVLSTQQQQPVLLRRWSGKRRWRLLRGFVNVMLTLVAMIASIGFLSLVNESKYANLLSISPKLAVKAIAAMRHTEKEMLRLEAYHPQSEDVDLTCLAIRALLWSLRNAATNTDGYAMTRGCIELSTGSYILNVLLERGYCPHGLSNLSKYCSVATLHYLSAFTSDVQTHKDCTRARCAAYIVSNESQYVTRHMRDTCTCAMVRIDKTETIRIIEDGKIPVIDEILNGDSVTLSVRPASLNVPYIAISHSWSGGLGNPRENALPTCQLRFLLEQLQTIGARPGHDTWLASLVNAVTGGRAAKSTNAKQFSQVFWIDTLCIPTWSEATESVRTQAVTRMNQIYADAQHVIVLDPALRALPGDATPELFLASVATSSWMTRCWTYLEGRLAQSLQVAINGEIRDIFDPCFAVASEVTQWSWNMRVWDDKVQIKREIAAEIYKIIPLKDITVDTSGSGLEHFVQCWNELGCRTTSRPADRLIILALMLDLSIFEMQQLPTIALKLQATLRTQPQLPLTFLFDVPESAQEALPVRRNEWVPQSISGHTAATYGRLRRAINSRTTEHGFLLECEQDQVKVIRFRRPVAHSQAFEVFINEPGFGDCKLCIDTLVQDSREDHGPDPFVEGHIAEEVLILARSAVSRGRARFFGRSGDQAHGQGCLLAIAGEGPNSLLLDHARPIAYTVVFAEDIVGRNPETDEVIAANLVAETMQLQLDTGKHSLVHEHKPGTDCLLQTGRNGHRSSTIAPQQQNCQRVVRLQYTST